MFGGLRRGHLLVRSLPKCISRSASTSLLSRSVRTPNKPITLPARAFHVSSLLQNYAAQAVKPVEERDVQPLPESEEKVTRFEELETHGLVDPRVVEAITKQMRLTDMTEIQVETIHHTLRKRDVLAQAKTGTGKTLAFLVPIIQNMIRDDPSLRNGRPSRGFRYGGAQADDIRAVIISPTRELAEQIAVEARKVVRNTGIKVQTAVGGTRKMEGLRRIQQEGCHLLVGTPGRLIDIFSDPRSGVKAPQLTAFVLDEADRLLDAGFAPAIQELQTHFPRSTERQTLMFSATVAPEIMNMVRRTMKRDFTFIKTVKDDEVPTHLAVPQKAIFLDSPANQMPAILEVAKQAIDKHKADPANNRPFKAIVYYNSTSEVTLAQAAFNRIRANPQDPTSRNPLNVESMEMHSRLTQGQRTRNSTAFRYADSAILFSSDVTARGMDFPNVTHVIQVGVPQDRESYIHRLGRTARANKTGEGWLLITKSEYRDLRQKLRGLPIKEDNVSLQTASASMSMSVTEHPEDLASILTQVKAAFNEVHFEFKEKAYTASLNLASQSRERFRELNDMTKTLWNLPSPPAISRRLAEKLNLSRHPDVNISTDESRSSMFDRDSNSRGGSNFGARGGSNFRGSSNRGGSGGMRGGSGMRRGSNMGGGFSSRGDRPNFGGDRSRGNDDFDSRKIFDFKHDRPPRRDGGRSFGGQGREGRDDRGPFAPFNRDARR